MWGLFNNFQELFTNWDFSEQLETVKCCTYPKKGDKELLQNYCPLSLLLVCSKIFERIVFNPVLKFLEENNLCPHQSRFRLCDSCQSQLLSIVHGICASFDQNPTLEVRANFLDISKAFDKVGHEGLLLSVLKYQEVS